MSGLRNQFVEMSSFQRRSIFSIVRTAGREEKRRARPEGVREKQPARERWVREFWPRVRSMGRGEGLSLVSSIGEVAFVEEELLMEGVDGVDGEA